VVYLPPELGTDDGGEDLGQYPHPRLLVDNVQLLKPLAHGSRQHVVRLQKPAPARPVLLCRRRAVAVACEEDDFVFEPLEQVIFLGQACEDVGQKRVVVGFVRVRERCRVEDVDGPAFVRGKRRAVENGSCDLGEFLRVAGTVLWWGDC
jgi:hypothetical protein